jgi:hypothetical protein
VFLRSEATEVFERTSGSLKWSVCSISAITI